MIDAKKWMAGDPTPLPGHAPAYYDLTDAAKTAIAGKVVNNKALYPIREEAKRGKMFVFGKMTIIFTPELYSKAIDLAIWEGYIGGEAHPITPEVTFERVEKMLLDWAKLGGADPGREWSLKNNNLADVWARFGQGKAKEQRLAVGATQEQRAKISRAIEDTLAPVRPNAHTNCGPGWCNAPPAAQPCPFQGKNKES